MEVCGISLFVFILGVKPKLFVFLGWRKQRLEGLIDLPRLAQQEKIHSGFMTSLY